MDLDIYGFVGIIMLIGIVKKNAIMMIDFAIETRARRQQDAARRDPRGGERAVPADHDDDGGGTDGRDPDRARLGRRRRHRRPLGVAVVGGLAFSQLVTLYVTPVFYTYFDELQTWFATRAERRRAHTGETAVPGQVMPAPAGD